MPWRFCDCNDAMRSEQYPWATFVSEINYMRGQQCQAHNITQKPMQEKNYMHIYKIYVTVVSGGQLTTRQDATAKRMMYRTQVHTYKVCNTKCVQQKS